MKVRFSPEQVVRFAEWSGDRNPLHVDPRYARGWNNLGNALRDAGRWSESLAAFERAVEVDDRYALAWSNLGAMRRLAGEFREKVGLI